MVFLLVIMIFRNYDLGDSLTIYIKSINVLKVHLSEITHRVVQCANAAHQYCPTDSCLWPNWLSPEKMTRFGHAQLSRFVWTDTLCLWTVQPGRPDLTNAKHPTIKDHKAESVQFRTMKRANFFDRQWKIMEIDHTITVNYKRINKVQRRNTMVTCSVISAFSSDS